MSVQAASSASAPWQILAEMRAARAAATDDGAGATATGASSALSQSGGTSNAVSGGPPQPAPGLLQFLQQFQSAFADPGATATSAGPTATNSPGDDATDILAEVQSMVTQLQQGISDVGGGGTADAAGASASGPAGASGSAPGGTQTGNDLALQFLAGLQGAVPPSAGRLGFAA